MRGFEIAQTEAQRQKQRDPDAHRNELLVELACVGGGTDAETDRDEEERNCFQLEAGALEQLLPDEQNPLDAEQNGEGREDRHALLGAVEHQLQPHKKLEDRQQHQRQTGAVALSGPGAGIRLQPRLLPGDRLQNHLQPGEADGLAVIHGSREHLIAVDLDLALAANVGDHPASVVQPGQNGVVLGDRDKIQHDVRALFPAQKVFPVGHGQKLAGCQTQPRPDLRLAPEAEQGAGAADDHEQGQQRQTQPQRALIDRKEGDPVRPAKKVQYLLHIILLNVIRTGRRRWVAGLHIGLTCQASASSSNSLYSKSSSGS